MRAFSRYNYRTEVKIEYQGETFTGISRNISQGGMFVEIGKEFSIGTLIKIRFSLPYHKEPIVTNAQVRWVERKEGRVTGMGIQFLRLKPIEIWAINQLGKK